MKRYKTNYPGVFYRKANRLGGKGHERVYYIVFKKDGKVYEEKVGRQFVDDMTPARTARVRAERIEGKRQSRKEIREAQKAESEVWTVERLWQEYSSANPPSDTDRGRYLNYIKPPLGFKQPQDIAPLDVERLRLKLGKTLKPQTVKHVLMLLKRIVNCGVKHGLTPGLPFKPTMPRVDNHKTEDLTQEQMAALVKAIDDDWDIQAQNFMRMVLYTGMRRGELFKLQWQDIDFERGFIRIRDPKGGKAQVIFLNQEAREVLRNHPRDNSNPYVFPGRGGKQRSNIKRPTNRIKERAGLPKDFRALHGLRHVYASMLASSGQVDLYTLQKLLTHKSPAMTQRYAHLRDEALRSAAELAGNLMDQTINGTTPQTQKVGEPE